MIPLLDLGGSGPPLHWAPANGFPFTTYRPLITGLQQRYRSVAVPPRALRPGAGSPPPVHGTWQELADDILGGLRRHEVGPVVAIGHSFGGVASILAALADPTRFRGLVLLDPTLLTPERAADFRADRDSGWANGYPLAIKARARKADFETAEEAFGYWRGKGLFGDWTDEALALYVEGMLVPREQGGFRLAWSPEWEAYYYESIHLDVWPAVERLPPELPVLAIAGGASDTFVPEAIDRLRHTVPWAAIETIPGAGHLFPQAAPEPTLERISHWLARLAG